MKNFKSKEDIHHYIYRPGVNSYNRFQEFLDIEEHLEKDLRAYALITAYDCSDNTFMWKKRANEEFLKVEARQDFIMNKEELGTLLLLPDKITIYRGMTKKERDSGNFGVSWTLDKKVAEFFAYEYRRNFSTRNMAKTVHSLTIDKKEIIAYCNERNEHTVFYVHNRQKLLLQRKKKEIINRIKDSLKFSISIKNHKSTYGNWRKKDKLHVNSITSIIDEKDNQRHFQIDISFRIRNNLSLDFFAKDIEMDYYQKLASIQLRKTPKKVRDYLRKVIGLPSGARLSRQYILEESKGLGPHSIKSEFVDMKYDFKIKVPNNF